MFNLYVDETRMVIDRNYCTARVWDDSARPHICEPYARMGLYRVVHDGSFEPIESLDFNSERRTCRQLIITTFWF